MAKDLFDIEFAIQRNNDATLVSRTAAELRVSERNKDLLNKAGVQITGDVVNGDVVHGDKVNGNVIINRNKTDK
jgi:tRNA A-37 threonylcarbamoyl transferase component Bud32